MKKCNQCGSVKALEEFPKNSKGLYGRAQKCKPCTAEVTAKYVSNNYHKVYASKFNTTEQVIEQTLSLKICSLCGSPPKERKRHSIDHCHKTGKIRGLLCDECNTGLGKFKDDPHLLQKAIEYLQKHHG